INFHRFTGFTFFTLRTLRTFRTLNALFTLWTLNRTYVIPLGFSSRPYIQITLYQIGLTNFTSGMSFFQSFLGFITTKNSYTSTIIALGTLDALFTLRSLNTLGTTNVD